MTEGKRFAYYEHKGAGYILDDANTELDFIEMLGDCLGGEEIVDLLNEQDDRIEKLEICIERSMKSKMALLSYVEDVLNCAKDGNFYDNEEIVKAISRIVEYLKVSFY